MNSFFNKFGISRTIFLFLFIAAAAFLVANQQELSAQDDFDSKGKQFWLTFPPNYHNNSSFNSNTDGVYIFIASDVPTKGTIRSTNYLGVSDVLDFEITDPSQIYVYKRRSVEYELRGYIFLGNDNNRNNSEQIARQSFYIETEEDVTIYAHSQAQMTSDATLLLPQDVLGKEYIVMSYNSDGRFSGYEESDQSTASQFAIIASENNTHVQILPSEPTKFHNLDEQNIILDAGESYLVQAKITFSNRNTDLSGTYISADKPVAVFGSQQRSLLPISIEYSGSSRDYLLEQMLPINTWGTNSILIPFPKSIDEDKDGSDLYRIAAASNNTTITLNGGAPINLNRGEYIERKLNAPVNVQSDGKILSILYKKTSKSSNQYSRFSDPLAMLMPPVEQYMDNYKVINIQADEGGDNIYEMQYLTVVIPDDAINSLKIDGQAPSTNFDPIPGTEYYYSHIESSDGTHTLTADRAFGLCVVGYGVANSYGYIGGLAMNRLDNTPPAISGISRCYSFDGVSSDSLEGESRLIRVETNTKRNINIDINIDKFTPPARIVNYHVQLINQFEDGFFAITAEDSSGHEVEYENDIPGFTVNIKKQNITEDDPLRITEKVSTQRDYCRKYTLTNYGKFQHIIDNFKARNNIEIRVNYSMPFTILPGGTVDVDICYRSDVPLKLTDTVYISEECGDRNLIIYDLEFIPDTSNPQITYESDSCNTFLDIIITDSLSFDRGLAEYFINKSDNCLVEELSRSDKIMTLKLTVLDNRQDAIYDIRILDSSGHETIFSDTIPGFTLSLPDMSDTVNVHDFGVFDIGTVVCDTIKIHNYGLFAIDIDDPFIYNNNRFSMPQSQFPITVSPGEFSDLTICYRPGVAAQIDRDTILISALCDQLIVPVLGEGDTLFYDGDSRCDVPVKLTAYEIPDDFFLKQSLPHPVVNQASIRFGLPENSEIELVIYDIYGNRRKTLATGIIDLGVHQVNFAVDNLSSGTYICILKTKSGSKSELLIISK